MKPASRRMTADLPAHAPFASRPQLDAGSKLIGDAEMSPQANSADGTRSWLAATWYRIKSETRMLLQSLVTVECATTSEWSARERRDFGLCLALSAIFYLACAVFCTGFHHPDEYFQVIEFASVKLGWSETSGLPWEFAARARSWMQPALYVGVAKLAIAFDVQRPLTLQLVFRLVTGLISWCALWLLIGVGRRWFAAEVDRRALYWVAALFCLLPYLGVRTSSETMSAAALWFGIVLLEWRTQRTKPATRFGLAVLAGVAFGSASNSASPPR
jgi:phosphatidylinositol glycan class B